MLVKGGRGVAAGLRAELAGRGDGSLSKGGIFARSGSNDRRRRRAAAEMSFAM